jgi:hypothetical protein
VTHSADIDAPRPGRSYCSQVTSYQCLAPAGYRTGSGSASVTGVRRIDLLTCAYCHEPVCKNCQSEFNGEPVCEGHEPEELADWIGLTTCPIPSEVTSP